MCAGVTVYGSEARTGGRLPVHGKWSVIIHVNQPWTAVKTENGRIVYENINT